MIFETILIKNLFSYYGEQEFNLGTPQGDRNVVVISGRNGYGKTSFINSVKLLFSGVSDVVLSTVQAGRKLNPRQYLLGIGDEWQGIMNLPARREGAQDFGVRIRWKEDLGSVTVKRFWCLGKESPRGDLTVELAYGGELLRDGDAQEFLDQRLPKDYVPFFFFDGEQIQVLAEANRKFQIQQIERLLNISQIETLDESLGAVVSDLRKDASDEKAKSELAELRKEKDVYESQLKGNDQEQGDLKCDIEDLERQIFDDNRYIESLRAHNYQVKESDGKRKKKELEDEVSQLRSEVAETLPAELPLWANLPLVEQAALNLKRLVESESAGQVDLLQGFVRDLPQDLFDKPPYPRPPLTEIQLQFYKSRLTKLLQAYIPEEFTGVEVLFKIEITRAKELRTQLEYYCQASALRRQYAQQLRTLWEKKNALTKLIQQLEDLSSLSEDEREIYRERKSRLEDRLQNLGRSKERLETLSKEARRLGMKIKEKQEEIYRQEERVQLSQQARRKVDVTTSLRNLFRGFRDQLKSLRRSELEEAINKRFRSLMKSHGLVDRIEVDADFGLHYRDNTGEPVGMANLSTGMKQLAATSLLWALKEVSGRPVPVVIDTPLARMDRVHQENLLKQYYPKAGHQVIVLPTDAELDRQKYSLLTPFIYREYRLENPEGNRTIIVQAPMYDLNEENPHA